MGNIGIVKLQLKSPLTNIEFLCGSDTQQGVEGAAKMFCPLLFPYDSLSGISKLVASNEIQ